MYIKDNELHLVWCIGDVKHKAKKLGKVLNDAEAVEVLNLVLDQHDSNVGTSWQSIEDAINQLFKKVE